MHRQHIPYVLLYKFPVTAISSIATRISGVGLTGFYLIGGISHLCNIDLYKKYEKLENPYKKVINYSTKYLSYIWWITTFYLG